MKAEKLYPSTPGHPMKPLVGCKGCGVWERWGNCRPRWNYMKATGGRNKARCWRPEGIILVWDEVRQAPMEGTQDEEDYSYSV